GMQNLVRIFKEHFFDRSADMPLPNYFLPSGGKVVLESVGAVSTNSTTREIRIQDYAEGEYEIKKAIPRGLAMALCNLQLGGRFTDLDGVSYHKYASPAYPSVVRQAAIESILRLYFAEDPRGDPTAPRRDKSRVFGPVAAISYALKLIDADDSPRYSDIFRMPNKLACCDHTTFAVLIIVYVYYKASYLVLSSHAIWC
ncbi:hypothetical protein AaE_001083, partial [Aphanomyces astaci]